MRATAEIKERRAINAKLIVLLTVRKHKSKVIDRFQQYREHIESLHERVNEIQVDEGRQYNGEKMETAHKEKIRFRLLGDRNETRRT